MIEAQASRLANSFNYPVCFRRSFFNRDASEWQTTREATTREAGMHPHMVKEQKAVWQRKRLTLGVWGRG